MTNAEIAEARREAEEALLGAILIESAFKGVSESVRAASKLVRPEHFLGYYDKQPMSRQPKRVRIYQAMLDCESPPHQITVAHQLFNTETLIAGDCAYLCHLVAVCPCSLDFESYALAIVGYAVGKAKPRYTGAI